MTTCADLAETALRELREREVMFPQLIAQGKRDAGEAGTTLAAWRAIHALFRDGAVEIEPCLGGTPALAWPELVAAVHAAVTYRARREDSATPALREIRALLLRSAIRAGAQLPSFDKPQAEAA